MATTTTRADLDSTEPTRIGTTPAPEPVTGLRRVAADAVSAVRTAARVVDNLRGAANLQSLPDLAAKAVKTVRTTSWKKNVEFPIMVAVETTNKCNATCWFCPITEGSKRPPAELGTLIQLGKAGAPPPPPVEEEPVTFNLMKRPLGFMSDELFEKIIEDCREFPLRRIEPYLHGEPFMDKKIFERIEHINKRLPDTELNIVTNGSFLTKKAVDKLKELKIDSLVVSLNTAVPEKYNAIMGLNFKKTLENIERVAAENRTDKPVAKRFVMRMTAPKETTPEEIDRFRKLAKSMGARPVIVSLHNYKGDINSERPVPRFPCYFVMDLDILWDGNTALCCMDHDGEYNWGDVKQHSVLEVFNSTVARRYRDLMRQDRRDELAPCNSCNMFFWNFNRTGLRRPLFGARMTHYLIKHKPLRF